ncbi:MAG: hypothetical protein AAFN44_00095 [Pseudomonadota bacterium]
MSALSDKDREELSLLLPWYANGTLDAEDSARVEQALAEDDALAREFDLILEDQAAMIDVVSEEEVPSSISERFKAALQAEIDAPPVRKGETSGDGLVSRMMSLLFPAQPRAYAAVAAIIAILLPVVALVSFEAGNQNTVQYQTASGEDPVVSDGVRMLVKFNADVSWTKVDAFLKENAGQIVKGPTPDGFYELEFAAGTDAAEEMERLPEIFEFALPAN